MLASVRCVYEQVPQALVDWRRDKGTERELRALLLQVRRAAGDGDVRKRRKNRDRVVLPPHVGAGGRRWQLRAAAVHDMWC